MEIPLSFPAITLALNQWGLIMTEQIYNVRRWPDDSHMLPFAVDMATAAQEAARLNRHSHGEFVSYDVTFDRVDTEDFL